MIVYVDKTKLNWLKEMQDEARTRSIEIFSHKNLLTDIEVELKEVK